MYLNQKSRLLLSFSSDFNAHEQSLSIVNEFILNEDNINIFNDFWHFGAGTELTINWGNIVFGATYASSRVDIPQDNTEDIGVLGTEIEGILSEIKYQRLRFVVGVELPLFTKTIKELKSSMGN